MARARIEMDLGSRGANLRTIGRELRNMDAAKVTGIFKKALEDAARPYPMRVRASALAIPVKEDGKHTGLRARIAQCATQTSWTTGREAGVSVWMDTRRMEPDYRTLPLYMDGVAAGPSRRGYTRWRHPVYGLSVMRCFRVNSKPLKGSTSCRHRRRSHRGAHLVGWNFAILPCNISPGCGLFSARGRTT